jgi:hypothetical protein
MTQMFHAKEGLYFDRTEDGGVRILKREKATDNAPEVMDIALDADSWASAVASVSASALVGKEGAAFQWISNIQEFGHPEWPTKI